MRISVIPIGNSRGIRIPQAVLKQCGFRSEVDLEVQDDKLVLRPLKERRPGKPLGFHEVGKMTDNEIRDILREFFPAELAIALVGAEDAIKAKIFQNMSEAAEDMLKEDIAVYEKMDAKELIIAANRARFQTLWMAQQ